MRRSEVPGRRWQVEPAPDPALTAALAAALAVPKTFAGLLVQRGYHTTAAARAFLRPGRDQLHDPLELPDLGRAVDRLVGALERAETILVHGDYDVDGQCAAAIVSRVLRLAGARVVPFVPHRLRDGYDLSEAGVRAASDAGAGVIVALDCGTTALGAVRSARAAGLDVIVVDHHMPGPEWPDALALVNPRRPDSAYPFPELCGAGLAWKLALALTAAVRLPEGAAWHCLDLAGLATVADLVPLVGENRAIVRLGLKLMPTSRWPGLLALLAAAGLGGKPVRAGHLGYMLGPRLNAAGRIGDAADGLRLLLTDDLDEALVLAAQLERQNEQRQALDRRTLEEALDELEAAFDPARDAGVVLARDTWHPGVIGIVASRVLERIARPVILVAFDGDIGRGSGRSVSRCDLHAALARCAGHLEKWGGHRMAAGLTVRRDRLPAFRDAFNEACAAQLRVDELVPTQRVDAVVGLADLSDELERLLRAFEPTGIGNPAPVLGLEGVALSGGLKPMGEEHVRFVLSDGVRHLRTVGFGMREEVERVLRGRPARLRAAIRLERDTFQGRDQLEARLVALAGE